MRLLAVFAVVLGGSAAQEPYSQAPVPANAPYRIGGGVTAPSILLKVEPEYSEEARRARMQGKVVLFVIIDPQGKPGSLKVIRSLGLGLDEEAIKVVEQWRFRPGTKEGRPVAVQATIEVNFRLLDKPTRTWHLASILFRPPGDAERPHVVSTKFPGLFGDGNAFAAISFEVDESGKAMNLQVDSSSEKKAGREVMEAVRDWKFDPGMKDGKPVVVPCSVRVALQ
jgi:TonB family protein